MSREGPCQGVCAGDDVSGAPVAAISEVKAFQRPMLVNNDQKRYSSFPIHRKAINFHLLRPSLWLDSVWFGIRHSTRARGIDHHFKAPDG
jgi:hypothetical protein